MGIVEFVMAPSSVSTTGSFEYTWIVIFTEMMPNSLLHWHFMLLTAFPFANCITFPAPQYCSPPPISASCATAPLCCWSYAWQYADNQVKSFPKLLPMNLPTFSEFISPQVIWNFKWSKKKTRKNSRLVAPHSPLSRPPKCALIDYYE